MADHPSGAAPSPTPQVYTPLENPQADDTLSPNDNDGAYDPFDDYAESRNSHDSDSPRTSRHSSGLPVPFVQDISQPAKTSPRPASYDGPARQPPAVDTKHRAAYSVDSPRPQQLKRETSWYLEDLEEETTAPETTSTPEHTVEPPTPQTSVAPLEVPADDSVSGSQSRGRSSDEGSGLKPRPRLDRSATSWHTAVGSVSDDDDSESQPMRDHSRPLTMSSRGVSPRPTELNLRVDPNANSALHRRESKKTKSPVISGLFGWRRHSDNRPESPTTSFTDSGSNSRSHSPRIGGGHSPSYHDRRPSSPLMGENRDYFSRGESYYGLPPSPAPEGRNSMIQLDEILTELREVSAELAGSIRRETELEDEVDRYRSQAPSSAADGTSDYYSDSGAGSLRMLPADSDHRIESLEKLKRKAEQEKAQLRLDIASKAEEELMKKKAMETEIQSLEESLRARERASSDSDNTTLERMQSLETALEVTKRKLNEERHLKQNFEDLFNSMKEDLASYHNLKEEVVPQLKSRVEELETRNADMQSASDDNARMQQENQSLRNENQTLANARRLQLDMQQSNPRFQTIAEEEDEPMTPRSPMPPGLSRQNSLARSRSVRQRSGSASRLSKEGLQSMVEGPPPDQNELEGQRDALHRTLKALILRQETMTRTHEKQLKKLAIERDNAKNDQRRRTAFYIEIQKQRHELNHLRRRADDATEQKWQCEKGLSGLQMDLDRAQQEITSLRGLLDDNDSLLSGRPSSPNGASTDESLEAAYNDLRRLHDETLTRIQATADTENPDTNTAALIAASSTRMEAFSSQIEPQLACNTSLRDRLRSTVETGTTEQQTSAQRIADLETALRAAEEKVSAAATVSEEAVVEHEDFVKTMRVANDEHARRGLGKHIKPLSTSSKEPTTGLGLNVPATPASTTQTPLFSTRTPRLTEPSPTNLSLTKTHSHAGSNTTAAAIAERTQTAALESCVTALESAAREADGEMQSLLAKMERAREDVGRLLGERDEAIRRSRELMRGVREEMGRLGSLGV